MNEGKDLLQIWKQRIINESKTGDKANAVRRANTTVPTYDRGIKKEKFEDLTDKQAEVLEQHIKVLDERKEEVRRKKEQYATN